MQKNTSLRLSHVSPAPPLRQGQGERVVFILPDSDVVSGFAEKASRMGKEGVDRPLPEWRRRQRVEKVGSVAFRDEAAVENPYSSPVFAVANQSSETLLELDCGHR